MHQPVQLPLQLHPVLKSVTNLHIQVKNTKPSFAQVGAEAWKVWRLPQVTQVQWGTESWDHQPKMTAHNNELFYMEREKAVRVNPKVVPQRPSANRPKFLLHKGVGICRKSTPFTSVLSVADKISLNRAITLKLMKIQQMLNLWHFIALLYLGKETSFTKILMKKCSFCFWIHWMPVFNSLFLFSVPTVASSSC